MTFETFSASVTEGREPPDSAVAPPLRALWLEARGDWSAAHALIGDLDTPEAARIHAYLHRKEGDEDNARYWYRRAGRPFVTAPLTEEWTTLVNALLAPTPDP